MKFNFSSENCQDYLGGLTNDEAAQALNDLGITYADGRFNLIAPGQYTTIQIVVAYSAEAGSENDEAEALTNLVMLLFPNEESIPDTDYSGAYAETKAVAAEPGKEYSFDWVRVPDANYIITSVTLSTDTSHIYGATVGEEDENEDTGNGDDGDETGGDETEKTEPEYIYPTGTISFESLEATSIGFKNHQSQTGYSHIRIMVAEIQANGVVGGEGHVWESDFFDKNIDYVTTLADISAMCEGHALTNFNVSYTLLQKDDAGNYEFVGGFIAGGATTVTTFSVSDSVDMPVVNIPVTAYCLDPVLIEINRLANRDIQKVQVSTGGYVADFEFYPDRNILKIDISEYLKALWSNVDVFEFQQIQTTVVVTLLSSSLEELEKTSTIAKVVYGKNPDAALPSCKLRLQWLDKYGYLHDEYFKIVESVSTGESKQKYVVNREDREDKTGEKTITLAFILANNDQKEALKTIVFSDHVRAWIGETWKRVQVANSYKTGKGRERQNFEFTVKYAL